jgi:hypothetical protein
MFFFLFCFVATATFLFFDAFSMCHRLGVPVPASTRFFYPPLFFGDFPSTS